MPYDESSGGGRPIPSTSSREALLSLCKTINFIYNWIQCFEVTYDNIIIFLKGNMSDLFKTILESLPKTNWW